MNSTFNFKTDVRPRAVAKDLAAAAKELNVKLSLTGAQQVTAAIYGYKSWKDLISKIGTTDVVGPEDHELEHSQVIDREQRQLRHLYAAGFSRDQAISVMNRLKPTGRMAESVSMRPSVTVFANGLDYHPNRVRFSLFHIGEDEPAVAGDTSLVSLYLKSWIGERASIELDKAMCSDVELSGPLFEAAKGAWTTGFIIDASAQAHPTIRKPLTSERRSRIPATADGRTYYVYLGPNAFPSPYKMVGIEGAYVTVFQNPDKDEEMTPVFDIRLVCSAMVSDKTEMNRFDGPAILSIRDAVRGVRFELNPMSTVSHSASTLRHSAMMHEREWASFIPGPTHAAINGIIAYLEGEHSQSVGVFDKMPEDMVRKIERASTGQKFESVVKDTPLFLPVVYLGRNPPDKSLFTEQNPSYSFEDIEADPALIHAMIDDALDMDWDASFELSKLATLEALSMSMDSFGEMHADVRANAAFLQACIGSLQTDHATTNARSLLKDENPMVQPYLPLAWLAFKLCGNQPEAAACEARYLTGEHRPSVHKSMKDAAQAIDMFKVFGKLKSDRVFELFTEHELYLEFDVRQIEKRPTSSRA